MREKAKRERRASFGSLEEREATGTGERTIHARRMRTLSLACASLVFAAPVIESVPLPASRQIRLPLETWSPMILVAGAILAYRFRRRIHGYVSPILASLALISVVAGLVLSDTLPAAPVVATGVSFLAVAAFLLSLENRLRLIGDWLAAIAVLLAATTLLAVLFRIEEIEGMQHLTAISVPSAMSLVLLGVGVMFADPSTGAGRVLSSVDAAGKMVRWFIPMTLGGTLILGFLVSLAVRSGLVSHPFAIPLFVEMQMILLAIVIWRNARVLQKVDDERTWAERALMHARSDLEQTVERRTAELRALNSELESYTYSISHDLRAPLRAVDGFSQILEEDYRERLDEEGRRLLGIIRTNARMMAQLITDLLSFSRVSRQQVNRRPVDLEQLAREVFDRITFENPVEQTLAVEKLPLAAADPAMIRQVLENLLSNAVKYSAPKAGGTIRISAETGEDYNKYLIEDEGVGFDPDYADKLFGVFQRLHHGDEFEGTGVGLSIVKRIVEKHGGDIGAEGRPGEGATFWFTLPVASDAQEEG